MLANAGPSSEFIATPSVCSYIVPLTLNSTNDVALSISSINTTWGMGGAEEGFLNNDSAHMPIVSWRSTLVNRLEMSIKLAYSSVIMQQTQQMPRPYYTPKS